MLSKFNAGNPNGIKRGLMEAHESQNQKGVWLPRSKGPFIPAIFAVISSAISQRL